MVSSGIQQRIRQGIKFARIAPQDQESLGLYIHDEIVLQ